jgi:hypothetical protein
MEAIRQAVVHNPMSNFIPLFVAICCRPYLAGSRDLSWPKAGTSRPQGHKACRRQSTPPLPERFASRGNSSQRRKKVPIFRLMIQESTEKIPAPPRMKDSKPAIYNKTTS